MKTLIIISLLAIGTLVRCSISSPTTMALDMYKRYAAQPDRLLVAYVGDYQAQGHTYQALVLQARDSAEWVWLQQEFSIGTTDDRVASSVLTADGRNLDQAQLSNPDGSIKVYLRRTVDNPDTSLVLKPRNRLAPTTPDQSPEPAGHSHALRINITRPGQPNRSETTGYVMGCDQNERALCLLFYETLDEEQAILTQVQKNIS